MPGLLDLALFLLLVLVGVQDHFVRWPRLQRALAAGVPGARVRAYLFVLGEEWLCCALVAALWLGAQRSWSALWLAPPTGWRLAVSLALVLPLAWLAVRQGRRLGTISAEKRRSLRPRLAPIAVVLPHTRSEWHAFAALSVTAGLCEEFLFRGYLVWLFTPWLGLYGAAALSAVLFCLGHLYQGLKPGLRSGVIGVVFALIALGTGSLLPGMVLHAIVDLSSGATGFALLREDEDVQGASAAVP